MQVNALREVRIARVDLRVADVARAESFYSLLTGLEGADGALRDRGGRALLRFVSDGVRAEPAPRRATGLFHTALRFSTRAGLAEALRRGVGARVRFSGASDHGVSEALYLDDPDGNGVELYYDRPRAAWPAPQDASERVGMFTAPLDLDSLLAAEPEEDPVVDVGHVHLKVSELDPAVEFWRSDVGFELMTTYGHEAAFLAADGYHHHIGANTWMSRHAAPGPRDLPGLERFVLEGVGHPGGELSDPDGNSIVIEPRAGTAA